MDQGGVLTPEEYEMLVQMGGTNAGLQGDIETQRAMAERLRGMSPLNMRGNSRMQVAPHGLEAIANIMGNYKAGKAEDAMKENQAAFNQNQSTQNAMIMRAILGQRGMQGAAPAAPTSPADPYAAMRAGGI